MAQLADKWVYRTEKHRVFWLNKDYSINSTDMRIELVDVPNMTVDNNEIKAFFAWQLNYVISGIGA